MCLRKVSQFKITDMRFKWKIIKAKIKKNMEEGKLGNEWYKVVAFAIFRLMLFPSETRVTGLEAPNVFVGYKHTKINLSTIILVEIMLSLNHCKTYERGVIWWCVLMLYLWVINHIKISRDIFNNLWLFDLWPLKIVIDEA